MTNHWHRWDTGLTRLQTVDFPNADESVPIAREHQLASLIHEECVTRYIFLVHLFLLVCLSVEWVLGAVVFLISRRLQVGVHQIGGRLRHDNVVDSLSFTLMFDNYEQRTKVRRTKSRGAIEYDEMCADNTLAQLRLFCSLEVN